ncbi:hypothetical protein MPNT_700002 [Candidatus Methylacidithermus pantelleriae]|uniref:Teneurin-like YD-shell domain-containing protein n=2 Tax=Candidatus Methylacidithermus pantelleriae TaxID=2744239 RepID=A0A8J2FXD8_9BACT|nr:hypothetical protein MPNT_700002 [Candidatus Methylacidithermus pantelleriae]
MATSVTDQDGGKTTFQYGDPRDTLRTETDYPNNVAMKIGYDSSDRIKDTTVTGPNSPTPLVHYTYCYKDNGCSGADTALLQQQSDKVANLTTNYTYSKVSRLQGATTTNSSGATTDTYHYNYDPVGNIISKLVGSSTTDYAYNEDNELYCSYPDSTSGCGASSATSYGYDGAGGLTSINAPGTSSDYSFAYDAKQQTTSITPPGSSQVSLSYQDANQVRLITEGSLRYGYNLLGQSSVAPNSGTANTTTFARDNMGTLVEERVAQSGSSAVHYYYLFDSLGSVIGLTNDSGNLVGGTTYRYEPYGKMTEDPTQGTSVSNPWGFAAGLNDSQTGFYKFGDRFYNPDAMRWTQMDPVGGHLSNPMTLHRYLYAQDLPNVITDPNGRDTTYCFLTPENYASCQESQTLAQIEAEPFNWEQLEEGVLGCIGGGLVGAEYGEYVPIAGEATPLAGALAGCLVGGTSEAITGVNILDPTSP